jgi:hypothetical protein
MTLQIHEPLDVVQIYLKRYLCKEFEPHSHIVIIEKNIDSM